MHHTKRAIKYIQLLVEDVDRPLQQQRLVILKSTAEPCRKEMEQIDAIVPEISGPQSPAYSGRYAGPLEAGSSKIADPRSIADAINGFSDSRKVRAAAKSKL